MKHIARHTVTTVVLAMCAGGLLCSGAAASAQTAPLPKMYPTYAYQGSWEEIGMQTALHFGAIIRSTGIIFNVFMGIGAEETRAYYDEIKDSIAEPIRQQMQGIAQGMTLYWAVPYETAWQWVLIANLGFDILNKHKLDQEVAGCTAFAVHSAAGTFLGHNTDNTAANLTMGSLLHYIPDNGDHAFLSFFSPAFVGAALAVNDAGLALTYNVGGRNTNPAAGLSVLLKTREVMATCATLAEAVDSFVSFLDSGGVYGYSTANFLLVDFNDASMARLQVRSDAIKVTYGQELKPGITCLAFSNEFDDDFSQRTPADLEKTSVISSRARYARLMELLAASEQYDLETCWNILTDSADGEPTNDTICRRGESTITTLANVFTEATAYYTIGPPCEYLPLYGAPIAIDLQASVQPAINGAVSAMGRPLSKVRVVLKAVSLDGITITTYTDANGHYEFNNLPTGTYRVTAGTIPHLPRRAIVQYREGEETKLDMRLLF